MVGVEKWYQPILLHFLYRDLFTFMIIGELWLAALCASVQSWSSTITYVFWFLVCSFTVTLPMSLYNVLKWVNSSLLTVPVSHSALKALTVILWFCRAYRSNSLKHSSLYEAFLPFLSPALLFVLSTTWVAYSPSNILELQPRIYYLMVGTAFANVTVSVCFLVYINPFRR